MKWSEHVYDWIYAGCQIEDTQKEWAQVTKEGNAYI